MQKTHGSKAGGDDASLSPSKASPLWHVISKRERPIGLVAFFEVSSCLLLGFFGARLNFSISPREEEKGQSTTTTTRDTTTEPSVSLFAAEVSIVWMSFFEEGRGCIYNAFQVFSRKNYEKNVKTE